LDLSLGKAALFFAATSAVSIVAGETLKSVLQLNL